MERQKKKIENDVVMNGIVAGVPRETDAAWRGVVSKAVKARRQGDLFSKSDIWVLQMEGTASGLKQKRDCSQAEKVCEEGDVMEGNQMMRQ